MGLESGTYVADLVSTNPPNSDPESQGAAHLRLIKGILQNSFPGSNRAWGIPTAVVKTASYNVVTGDQNSTIVIDTTSTSPTMTLPSLVSADAGWRCDFMKSNTGTNPYFIAPPSGTLQSGEYPGLTKTRRSIAGRRTRAIWTGSVWICDRVITVPLGGIIPVYAGGALPVGYEFPNGQTLSSAANYPDYFTYVSISGTTPDLRGRAIFGLDNMGGAAAGRITVGGLNYDGTIEGNAGGNEFHFLLTNEMPPHNHTIVDSGHSHSIGVAAVLAAYGGGLQNLVQSVTSGGSDRTTTVNGTGISINNTGSGNAHTILPPSMVLFFMMAVE